MGKKTAEGAARKEVARALRQARVAAGLTQDQLAVAAGVGVREMISQVEQGRSPLPLEHVAPLAAALHIDAMVLLTPDEREDTEIRARVQMARLPSEQQQIVLALMDSLLSQSGRAAR